MLAIASHTFREATRRKILLVAVVFSVCVAISSWFLPALEYSARIKMAISVCLGAGAFFTTIVAIVIAATSIPKDFDEKLVYTVLTKPVSRVNFLWGKILGYILVVILILGIMWLVTIGAVRAVAGRGKIMVTVTEPGGPAELAGLLEGDLLLALNGTKLEKLSSLASLVESTNIGEDVQLTVLRKGERHDIRLAAASPQRKGVALASPVMGKLGFDVAEIKLCADRSIEPAELVFHGKEGDAIGQISEKVWRMVDGGYGPNSVEARFANLQHSGLPPGDIRVAIDIEIRTAHVGKYVDDVGIAIHNPRTGQEDTFLQRLKGRTPSFLSINRQYLSEDGSLRFRVIREHSPVAFGVSPESFHVLLSPRSFELNLLRSYFVLFLQTLIVVAVASLGSAFLSGPVAMFAAFAVYICGSAMDMMEIVADKLKEGTFHMPGHVHGPIDPSQFGARWYDSIFYYLAKAYMVIFPDLRKFRTVNTLIAGNVIPWSFVGHALGYTALYAAVCVLLGSIIFHRREVK